MAWTTPTAWTSVAIALASLADSTAAVSSSTIANGTAKDIFIDLSLILGSITPGSAGPSVEFHLLPLLHDGATYPDITRADEVRPITTSAAGHAAAASGLRISPGTYAVAIVNRTGVVWAGSGNSLSYRTYSPG